MNEFKHTSLLMTEHEQVMDDLTNRGINALREEIKTLKAENDRLREDSSMRAIRSLRDDCDAMRADSDRYRVLRNRYTSGDLSIAVQYTNARTGMAVIIDGAQLDALVDAAMSKEPKA